ncbi:hypothetical protein [Sphingorhabdus contaminans]|uniref:Preprotein translocase subunit YajC n=1 Tax=Sphingorhabdus contaminans TaxID=1343899 RepID=A0A553WA74_9SPHN|nr:hypothetical protein [Sphingorhabdus contaminans]TSB01590.1 hypothetical protein FOM92_10415 [Sphingorhabdus contaminans]
MAMRNFRIALATVKFAIAVPLYAQPPELREGDVIFDSEGAQLGVVRKLVGDAAVIHTGTTKVTLGRTSFVTRSGKVTVMMSKSELESRAADVQSKGDGELLALLVPGAFIHDRTGQVVATVDNVAGKTVYIKVGEQNATLPVSALSKGPKGPRIAATAAEFEAQIKPKKNEATANEAATGEDANSPS